MEQNEGRGYLLRWLIPSLVALGIIFAWSNHFNNSFHWDDFPRIVDNKAMQSPRSFAQFFLRPRTSSELPEQTEYRPLLATSFALDYALAGAEPFIFHVDTFVWFSALLLALYALFRLVPGGSHFSSVIGTGLFALHPALADTVNYISQRGAVISAFGIVAGLTIWIVWPRMLPERLWVDTRRTAVEWLEEVNTARAARRNALYQRFVNLPLALYLVPVALAMLAEPS
ncbi:MAG: hypothetical protein M3N54_14870, partial [Acidobacteriota bacterium]|nr:hypothetical protein [Acidobacteriota bacterium]